MPPHASNFSIHLFSRNIEFSIQNFFKIRMSLEILDAEFPYKLSYFKPLCLLNKMAAKTVKRSIITYNYVGLCRA